MSSNKKYIIIFLVLAALWLGFLVEFLNLKLLWPLAIFALAVFFYFYTEVAFYILVAYLPFQLALNLSADIDLLSGRLLILVLFLVWLVKSLKQKSFFWQKDRITLALILFFVVALISLAVAQNQIWGIRKILVFASIFPLFFISADLMKKKEQIRKLSWVITGSAALSALIAAGQFLAQFIFGYEAVFNWWAKNIIPLFSGQAFGQLVVGNPSWFIETGGQTLMRAIGLFPDPHMLAFYLGLVSPLVLATAFFEKRHRLLLFAVYCLLFLVLLLTFSRGGYLGLLASVLVMGWLGWRHSSQRSRVFISSLFFVLVTIVLLTPVFGRFYSSFDLAEGSNFGRLKIWTESLAQAKNNLLLGVGLGNYPLALDFNANYRSAITSHNLYLDILVETGIFGLLAWLWFLGGAARAVLKEIIKQGALAVPAVGVLGALIYFVVHSFFETAIFNPTVLAFLMIILGLSVSLVKLPKNSSRPHPVGSH